MKRPKFTLAVLNHRAERGLPGHLGIRFTAMRDGELKAEFELKPHLLATNGYLHAGSVVTLADTAAGFGCMVHLPEGAHNFITTEIKSNHLSVARDGIVTCTAKIVEISKTSQTWDAVVTNKASGKTIALFRCTQMILYPK